MTKPLHGIYLLASLTLVVAITAMIDYRIEMSSKLMSQIVEADDGHYEMASVLPEEKSSFQHPTLISIEKFLIESEGPFLSWCDTAIVASIFFLLIICLFWAGEQHAYSERRWQLHWNHGIPYGETAKYC